MLFPHLTKIVPPYSADQSNESPNPRASTQKPNLEALEARDPAAVIDHQQPAAEQLQVTQQHQEGQTASRVYREAVPLNALKRVPAPADCPRCGKRSLTKLSYEIGAGNHFAALGAFAYTIVLFWVPYLVTRLKNVKHHCGNCDTLLATWHRVGNLTDVHEYP